MHIAFSWSLALAFSFLLRHWSPAEGLSMMQIKRREWKTSSHNSLWLQRIKGSELYLHSFYSWWLMHWCNVYGTTVKGRVEQKCQKHLNRDLLFSFSGYAHLLCVAAMYLWVNCFFAPVSRATCFPYANHACGGASDFWVVAVEKQHNVYRYPSWFPMPPSRNPIPVTLVKLSGKNANSNLALKNQALSGPRWPRSLKINSRFNMI